MKRRDVISGLIGVSFLLSSALVRAATKLPKSAVSYQDTPNGDKQCSNCALFVTTSDRSGGCGLVEGMVSSSGWCVMFSAASIH
jgi:hypothetical protein